MKRILVCSLLLCLLLAGCSITPPQQTPLPSITLPVPKPPVFPETYRRPAGLETDVPVLVNPIRDPSASSAGVR